MKRTTVVVALATFAFAALAQALLDLALGAEEFLSSQPSPSPLSLRPSRAA